MLQVRTRRLVFRHPASKAAAGILSFPGILFPRLPAPCPRNVRLHRGRRSPRWTEGALRGAWLSMPDGSDTCLLCLQSLVLPATVSPEVMTRWPALGEDSTGSCTQLCWPACGCLSAQLPQGRGVEWAGWVGRGKKYNTKNLQQANNLGRAVDRPLDCCEMTQ